MKPKILILSCVWDNLGDLVLGLRIRDIFSRWSPRIIYYYVDSKYKSKDHREFLAQNVPNYTLCDTAAEVIRRFKDDIMSATVILNTAPKYNQMFTPVMKMGYHGKFYRIFDYSLGRNETFDNDTTIKRLCVSKQIYNLDNTNNIFTGFGNGSSGMLLTDDIAVRTMSIWDKERYPYDNIFTCYVHNKAFGIAFIEFLHKNFADKRNLLVVQGRSWSDQFEDKRVVREGSLGKVREYYPDLHIISDVFPLHESNELFYYSHPITAATGNWSMSTCISYRKVLFLDWRPELTKTQCLFWEFLLRHGYSDLVPIFRYLINVVANSGDFQQMNRALLKYGGSEDVVVSIPPIMEPHKDILSYINEKKDRLAQFYDYIQEKHNLQENLYKLINSEIEQQSPAVRGAAESRPLVSRAIILLAILIVIIVLTVMIVWYIAQKIKGPVSDYS